MAVTAKDTNAVVSVKLDGVTVQAESNGTFNITLTEGQNVIAVTSAINAISEAYVIVIDYTPKA